LWALGVIAVSHLFLLGHSQEPLRLNVGDPWSEANVLTSLKYVEQYGFAQTSFTDILDVGPLTDESYRYTHYPPLSEIIYGAIHKYLGVSTLGHLRLFAIGFSALAMWLLFGYVRRLFDDTIALIATTLWSCNLLWMMYADMIHQAPVMQASAFLALWGLIRALEEPRLRYWIAAWGGAFACFLTSYDYFVFLPTAIVVTVGLRRGSLFELRTWRPIMFCATACVAAIVAKSLFVIGAVGWHEFLADLHFQFLERSTSTFEEHAHAVVPTLTRRATMVFSPLIWALLLYLIARIARPGTRKRFITEGLWLAGPALLFFVVFSQLSASQMLTMQTALPFYAICSAVVLARMFAEVRWRRYLATAILVFAPLWSATLLLRQDRAYLDEAGFAKVKAYLDEHDVGRDWIMCNLMADGPIQAYLGRHYWPAFSAEFPPQYNRTALDLLDRFGRDDFYVLFFTDPRTRIIDKSLWVVALPRKQWSVTGAPLFWPDKAAKLVREYDDEILRNLRQVDAEAVLVFPQMTLYRVTRAGVMKAITDGVPDVPYVEMGSHTSERHMLGGWVGRYWNKEHLVADTLAAGREECPWWGKAWCRTVLTKRGLEARGQVVVPESELLIRASARCDAELIVRILEPTTFTVAVNGAALVSTFRDPRELRAAVPRAVLVDGVNRISIKHVPPAVPAVTNMELRQSCR
jgi:hypothetical protein